LLSGDAEGETPYCSVQYRYRDSATMTIITEDPVPVDRSSFKSSRSKGRSKEASSSQKQQKQQKQQEP
jgi:hypothetical protein